MNTDHRDPVENPYEGDSDGQAMPKAPSFDDSGVKRRETRKRSRHMCPFCGSDHIKRSRRSSTEKILFGMVKPYRCLDCFERFYIWVFQKSIADFFRYLGHDKCPMCDGTELRISSGIKRGVIFLFFIIPYRCTNRICNFVFWRQNILGPLIFFTDWRKGSARRKRRKQRRAARKRAVSLKQAKTRKTENASSRRSRSD